MGTPQQDSALSRAEREKRAYDEAGIWDAADRWHRRFPHVFQSPNSRRYDKLFNEILRRYVENRRALEIGCSDGVTAKQVSEFGAQYVLGIDVSEELLKKARRFELPGKLEFRQGDVLESVEGTYDVIFGRSILHHIDYQPLLIRLYKQNLSDNGIMLFMEPLGSHPLIRLYHLIARGAHTPDEKPFDKSELQWLQKTFHAAEIHPINFFSFPFGLISHLLFTSADNILLRACDRVDAWLAHAMPGLKPYFRQFIVVIRK